MDNNTVQANEKDAARIYRTEDLVVYWYPELCAHVGACWKGLPLVFKPQNKPWVNLAQATAEDIIKTVDQCPTGALKYSLPEGSRVNPELARGPSSIDYKGPQPVPTVIKIIKNGPLMLEGQTRVFGPDGKFIKEQNRFALCRCGMTGSQPFCDGSHFRNGWKS